MRLVDSTVLTKLYGGVAHLERLQAEVDALKRLPAETAAKGKSEIAKAETLK